MGDDGISDIRMGFHGIPSLFLIFVTGLLTYIPLLPCFVHCLKVLYTYYILYILHAMNQNITVGTSMNSMYS